MGGVSTKDKLDLVNANNLTSLDDPSAVPAAGSRTKKRSLKSAKCPRAEDGLQELPAEGPTLTPEDKRYLIETWKTLESDPITVGIITFSQLFDENPNMKDVFEAFRQIEMDDVKASQELKQHAARVMGFVNKVILRLDSEEKYNPLMMELGCRHLSYGAKPQYIDLMGQQFIMVIRPSLVEANQWSDGAEAAWRKLFQVISHSMKQGLLDSQQTAAGGDTSPKRTSRLPSLKRRSAAPKHCPAHTIEY